MASSLVDDFRNELADAMGFLVEQSLVDDQRLPSRKSRPGGLTVLESDYWSDDMPRAQRRVRYADYYTALLTGRSYDLRFLDGALAQFQYEFDSGRGTLRRARVAFLPSPDLTSFQDDPGLYDEEIGYAFLDPRVVPVPLRFDFDSRPDVAEDMRHPVSHLTIGQYPHCRIALTSALTPYYFVELLLRSFYRSKDRLYSDELPRPKAPALPTTITTREREVVHIALPGDRR